MDDIDKINKTKKLSNWDFLVVFIGIIITVPMMALLGRAIFALLDNRPGALVGILLTIIIMLIFWAIIWGGIFMIPGLRDENKTQSDSARKVEELEQEIERLQKMVTELSQEKQLQNNTK